MFPVVYKRIIYLCNTIVGVSIFIDVFKMSSDIWANYSMSVDNTISNSDINCIN